MASGMYYRMYPNRILFKMYGFEKVDPEREQEIVNRLRRHTSSSSMAAADAMTACDEEVLQFTSGGQRPVKARHPDHSLVCPKSRLELMKETLAATHPRMQEYDVQRVFRRLQRSKTISSEVREMETRKANRGPDGGDEKTKGKEVTFQIGAQEERKRRKTRPQSAYGRLETDEPPDARTACRMFEEAQREKKFIQKLCRPTTATELKKKGFCYFCSIQKDQASERWKTTFTCQHCGGSGDPQPDPEKLRQQKSLVRRLRAPTRASEGGLPVCDKAPRDATVAIIGCPVEIPRRPLLCGLPRTRTIRGITARLNRPVSAPAIRHYSSASGPASPGSRR